MHDDFGGCITLVPSLVGSWVGCLGFWCQCWCQVGPGAASKRYLLIPNLLTL